MLENRRHMRIRQPIDITWNMPGEDIAGQGQILNISSSGILLQIDNSFRPLDNSVLSIDPEVVKEEKAPFFNKKGKVVWFRNIQSPRYTYLCGVEFLKDQGPDKGLMNWIDSKVNNIAQVMDVGILNNYMN